MDKNYINMCRQALDIQSLKSSEDKLVDGDRLCYLNTSKWTWDVENHNVPPQIFCFNLDRHIGINLEACIWLPRQEDLQGMVCKEFMTAIGNIESMTGYYFCLKIPKDGNVIHRDWTPEMLWLNYVMVKLHNKTWDGKDWVNG